MNKKLLAVAALVAIGGALNLGSRAAQSGQPRAPLQSLLSPASCMQPQWPDEARRYEIEGITTIRFEIGADGKVLHPAVTAGSGWKILDDAALRGIQQCVFKPGLDAAKSATQFPLQFVWKLSGAPALRALLVKDSCQPSARFAGFREADHHPSGSDGILLRFLLDPQGAPVRVAAEAAGQPPALVEQAVQYLQSCRFAYDGAARGERTDTAFGRVLLK